MCRTLSIEEPGRQALLLVSRSPSGPDMQRPEFNGECPELIPLCPEFPSLVSVVMHVCNGLGHHGRGHRITISCVRSPGHGYVRSRPRVRSSPPECDNLPTVPRTWTEPRRLI